MPQQVARQRFAVPGQHGAREVGQRLAETVLQAIERQLQRQPQAEGVVSIQTRLSGIGWATASTAHSMPIRPIHTARRRRGRPQLMHLPP